MNAKIILNIEDVETSESNLSENNDMFDPSPSSSDFSRLSRKSTLKSTTLKHSNESNLTRTSKTSIRTSFSSTMDVREYDINDTVCSVNQSDNNESPYEPVNFKMDGYGKISKFQEGKYDELQIKHSNRCLEKMSRQNLISENNEQANFLGENLRENKTRREIEEERVSVTNLNVSTHIEGQVSASQIFNKQDCHIWFSIDNWETFQESVAIQINRNKDEIKNENNNNNEDEEKTSANRPGSDLKTVSTISEDINMDAKTHFKYKFDFIIPKKNQNFSFKEGDFDSEGRPSNIQFHPVIKCGRILYLDNDFKIYSLKLRPEFQTV